MKLALGHAALLAAGLTVALTSSAGCGSESTSVGSGPAEAKPVTCAADADCAALAATPLCDTTKLICMAAPPGHEIGRGDGSPASVTLTEIYAPGAASKLVDLGFHPTTKDELWVVGYGDNSVHRGTGVGTGTPTWKRVVDPAAGHFMLKPPAIALGTPDRFGTCGDNLNERGGGDGDTRFFMGPALFSTDPAILGVRTPTGLGSHVDMLHNTPLCRGMAHVEANIFWVFNGYDHSLDKYNFNADHGPGNDDHSDGEIYRYAMGKVKGLDGTPSHVFYDAEDAFLYVADTGNGRIVRLDTTVGKKGASLERYNEPLKNEGVMDGTDVEVLVAPGTLGKPSGLEVRGGLIYVTDTETSTFYVFDKTGAQQRSLQVDLPAGSLAGMAFGPDNKLYFADKVGGRILRIDAQ